VTLTPTLSRERERETNSCLTGEEKNSCLTGEERNSCPAGEGKNSCPLAPPGRGLG
jgi:hypothetical protein